MVGPGERLAWAPTIGIGMQHVVAMFGATFLVPLITRFPPTWAVASEGDHLQVGGSTNRAPELPNPTWNDPTSNGPMGRGPGTR